LNAAFIALRKMVLAGFVLALTALPVAMGIGYLVQGRKGLLGAAIGIGLSITFIGITSVIALATRKLSVQVLGIVVLSSWLLKIVILMAVLAWLRNQDFYHRPSLLIAMLVGLVGYLTIEAVISLKSRALYVNPS
jgi:MFS superfamily sulfate permease-like transporter